MSVLAHAVHARKVHQSRTTSYRRISIHEMPTPDISSDLTLRSCLGDCHFQQVVRSLVHETLSVSVKECIDPSSWFRESLWRLGRHCLYLPR